MVLERTERELIEACRRGEREAFRDLFELHRDRVYSIALRFSGDSSAAMDIAQDVFLKLYGNIQSFRGDSAFQTWIYRLVVNSCFDHLRKTRRHAPLTDGFIATLRNRNSQVTEQRPKIAHYALFEARKRQRRFDRHA